MRICIYGYTIGLKGAGASEYANSLGRWLVNKGNDVTLVTGAWGDGSTVGSELNYEFLVSHDSLLARWSQVDFTIQSLVYFRRHKDDFDIIHSLSSFPQFGRVVSWVKKVSRLPVVHTLLAPADRKTFFDSLDGLIGVSKGVLERMQVPRTFFIPPFVDMERFRSPSPYDWGQSDRVLIGTMGAPYLRKGIRQLVEAIPRVLKSEPKTDFYLACDLPGIQFVEETRGERDYIDRFIQEHQLQDNVHILGYVDVPRFLKSLDLFVYAVQTTQGMIDIPPTLLECLAAGCGVVTSREGGISELIQDRHNGLLVEQKDRHRPEAYAEKIIELLRDRSLLNRIKENGPPSVERFELNRVGQEIVQCYEKVLVNREAGA